ncbi:MAG: hypothetical protein JO086_06750 [Acidimicrobiia bacterium]|nr:hypothetical protein [Acidimicrobiia bacterium]
MVRTRSSLRSSVVVSPYGVAVAALAGAWVAHLLEYARVWGWDGFSSSASRQVHTYLGPVGVVLIALAFVGVEIGLRSFRRLERLLAGVSDGSVAPSDAAAGSRQFTLPVTSLLSLVWVLQLVIYVVQENAELRAMGVHQPVLSVVTGTHQWAAAVHLLVGLLLVGALWLAQRPVAKLARAIREVVAWLASRRAAPALVSTAPRTRSWTPAERFGRHVWSRPPPAIAA